MRESWRAYRSALWKHSKVLVSGASAGALGIGLSIHPVILPAWFWFLVALASVGWLGFVVFHDVHSAFQKALKALDKPFPDLKIEAISLARRDTPMDYRLVASLRITNREQTRVNIELIPMVELSKTDEAVPLMPYESMERSRHIYEAAMKGEDVTDLLARPTPMHIEPLTTISLEYGFGWYQDIEPRLADISPESAALGARPAPLNGSDRLRLDIYEHISGQMASMYLPGTYETLGQQT